MNFYVLAGGESKRMGRDKAFLVIEGEPAIQRILRIIPARREQKIIVTNSAGKFRDLPVTIIGDIHPGCGPISGIHAGLNHSPYLYNCFLACDVPLLTTEIISEITAESNRAELSAFRTRAGFEPLCAVYSKSCLPVLEQKLDSGNFSLQDLPDLVDSKMIETGDRIELMNMNDESDYKYITSLYKKRAPESQEE
jgi:molybdopterin-guanine dinucleotide biosynthesis protein A